MEKVQNTSRITQMLDQGSLTLRDPETGYTYSICSVCPQDGYDCPVTSHDRDCEGNRVRITRVMFSCPACGNRFSARPEEMYLK